MSHTCRSILSYTLIILLILILTVGFTSSRFIKNQRNLNLQKQKNASLAKKAERTTSTTPKPAPKPAPKKTVLKLCWIFGCTILGTQETNVPAPVEQPKPTALSDIGRTGNTDNEQIFFDSEGIQNMTGGGGDDSLENGNGDDHPGGDDHDHKHNLKTSVEEESPDLSPIDEEWQILVFNLGGRPAWTTPYINHSMVEAKCVEANPCLASELVLPVCGSDGGNYLNTGVFQCAQKCFNDLTISQVGPCSGFVMPPEPQPTTLPPITTPPPKHRTPSSRVKLRGFLVQPLLRLFGFHVHSDGGVYLADETKNYKWWNY